VFGVYGEEVLWADGEVAEEKVEGICEEEVFVKN